jgi:hypothetical protein
MLYRKWERKESPYPGETLSPLRSLLARQVAQAIVLLLGVAALLVVEGWRN